MVFNVLGLNTILEIIKNNMPTKTEQIGVIVLKDSEDNLVGIIYKDAKLKNKNIFYSCTEMSFDELERLFKKESNIA